MVTAQRSALRRRTPAEYEDWYYNEATDEEYEQAMTPDEYAADYQRRAQQAQQRQPQGERRSAPPQQRAQAPARGQERAQEGKQSQPRLLIGVFALIIGAPFWFEAARFTRDGWVLAVNWLCDRLNIPWQVPVMDWRVALGVALILGIAYSRVESRPPMRLPKDWRKNGLGLARWHIERQWQVWAVWVFLIVTDVGSTYMGARARGATNSVAALR